MEINVSLEITPVIGVLILIAVALVVFFIVKGNFDLAVIVGSVVLIALFWPLAPLILLGDTVWFALRQNFQFAKVTGLLTVVSFLILLLM